MFALNAHNVHPVSVELVFEKMLECPVKEKVKNKQKLIILNLSLSLNINYCTTKTKPKTRKENTNKINVFKMMCPKKIQKIIK